MKTIRFRLMDNGTGIILTRQPFLSEEAVFVVFSGAPQGSVAVFDTERGAQFYRTLGKDGGCNIDPQKIIGSTRVSVIAKQGHPESKGWTCERLRISLEKDRLCLICPDDMNASLEIAILRLENGTIRKKIEETNKKLELLEMRVTQLMEGYDII